MDIARIKETQRLFDRSCVNFYADTLNIYRTAVSPILDLLCHEDFNVGRSEAESNIEIFMAQ